MNNVKKYLYVGVLGITNFIFKVGNGQLSVCPKLIRFHLNILFFTIIAYILWIVHAMDYFPSRKAAGMFTLELGNYFQDLLARKVSKF